MKAMAGELDFQVYPIEFTDFPVYKRNEASGGYKTVSFDFKHMSFRAGFALNYTHKDSVLREIFNDLRFRQALSLAIDRDDISNALYLGQTKPFTAPVSEAWTGFP